MIDSILILGGHIQALGLARQAKRKGVKVFIVIPDAFSVARFSHSVDSVFICKSEESLTNYLSQIKGRNTLLFPTNDEYIDFIARHYAQLKDEYTIALPDIQTVALFSDKTQSYLFAEKNGIDHPWSRYPKSFEDVAHMANDLDYPVVVKPAVMYSFHRQFGKKAFRCDNKEVLLAKAKELSDAGYPIESLILQEFLSGGAKNLYSYGFFAVNGDVKSSITVNRIRQNPMDFGNSTTFALTVDIPEVEQIAKRIISLTQYSGMGEVEFMFDKGVYKFLEINTRAWKWHTISDGRSFTFIGDWIDYLNRKDFSERKGNEVECAWVERLTDFAVISKGIIHRQVKLKHTVRSYCRYKVSAVWSIKDPLPAIMYVLMSPILFVKRY